MIAEIRERSNRPFNVNVFCHLPAKSDPVVERAWINRLRPEFNRLGAKPPVVLTEIYKSFLEDDDMLAALLADRPKAVSFHFGVPSRDRVQALRNAGIVLLGSATSVEEARILVAAGVDAVVAQGYEAGGHRGVFLSDDIATQAGTFALVPQIVDAVKVPVIAAGAVTDARGIAAAFALGAAGVQIGTAYLWCPESRISAPHRAALKSARDDGTVLTNLMTGRPARGFINRLMREVGPISEVAPEFPLAAGALAPLRAKAEAQGSGDFSPMWAGQAASLGRDMPAGQLTKALAAEALERMRALAASKM